MYRFPAADPGVANARTPARFLWWLAGRQWPSLSYGAVPATLGQVTTVILYTQQLYRPMDQIVSQTDTLMQGIAALRRLLGIQQAGTGEAEGERPRQHAPDCPDGTVELRGVGFRYPTRHAERPQQEAVSSPGQHTAAPEVVRDVSLFVRSGERLAVVGPSGSGKSSLARLVAGVYPADRGEVLLGGAPIAEQSLAEQRRRVALVTQETHVFQGSVSDNVVMASSTPVSHDTRDWALNTVGALEWVRCLPEGTETVVGSGGLELDPTQAQQLALARLLLAVRRW